MRLPITDVVAWEALDSRGRPTVACRLRYESGSGPSVVVPSGASTGRHEAPELRDGDQRYGGAGVRAAVEQVRTRLAPAVRGVDAADPHEVDRAIRASAQAANPAVAANAMLAVSLAAWAAALASPDPARDVGSTTGRRLPMPMINILSGGAHAGRALDIQDVLVVPVGASSFAEAIEWTWEVRRTTASLLRQLGHDPSLVADEGGFAARLGTNEDAFEVVSRAIKTAGFEPGRDLALAVDVAANQLQSDGFYALATEGRRLDADAWCDQIVRWCRNHPIISIEDPAGDDDWLLWGRITRRLGDIQVLGDDLFVTDVDRLHRGAAEGVANAVLVKPNQIGTVSQALQVVELAKSIGYATVLSARSGDSEDSWLADLAVVWDSGQIKVGSLARSERTAKWNRLLELEARRDGVFHNPFVGRPSHSLAEGSGS